MGAPAGRQIKHQNESGSSNRQNKYFVLHAMHGFRQESQGGQVLYVLFARIRTQGCVITSDQFTEILSFLWLA